MAQATFSFLSLPSESHIEARYGKFYPSKYKYTLKKFRPTTPFCEPLRGYDEEQAFEPYMIGMEKRMKKKA